MKKFNRKSEVQPVVDPKMSAVEKSLFETGDKQKFPTEVRIAPLPSSSDMITELARLGAKKLLAEALECEIAEYLAKYESIRDEQGHKQVVRKANGWDLSCVTSEPEKKMILLQRELVEKLDCLFIFILDPEVGSTNNQSERDLRQESQACKAGRTSKTAKGAKRRSVIISVFGTLKRRIEQFTLPHLLAGVFEAFDTGILIFKIFKPKIIKNSS